MMEQRGTSRQQACEALAAAGKSACKANAAVARELACWVWAVGLMAEEA